MLARAAAALNRDLKQISTKFNFQLLSCARIGQWARGELGGVSSNNGFSEEASEAAVCTKEY